MRVKVARSSGFCFGVRRAMDLALALAAKEHGVEICTDGPLIHNPQALEFLESHGIKPLEGERIPAQGIVIIRSHGVSPRRRRALEQTGARIVDATCPKVKQVQSIIDQNAKQGAYILIIGDAGHAEVRGLVGFVGEHGKVIQTEEELADIAAGERICVVAQTTQNREKFQALAKKIRSRFPQAKIHDTICEANRSRQEELKSLCETVDALLVVGGKESGNTRRLVEIAQSTGKPTFFGETEEDFDLDALKRFEEVGIIGGASTPDWVLDQVVKKLERANF
jgi:(E)-4-hydroxy-3-methyl-but-2-enyl pyrophosphate reductase